MGKFCTTDKEESIKFNKIYIDKCFYSNLPKKNIIPHRCKYCKTILTYKDKYYKLGYCSEWCYEIENPPKIVGCGVCGIPLKPILRKHMVNGKIYINSSGVYAKYCDKHKRYGNKNKKKNK